MKKLFASTLLTAFALFAQPVEASDPRWGYVYADNTQDLSPGSLVNNILVSGDAVDWADPNKGIQGVFSEGVFVDRDDTTKIVIQHPGFYLVTYSATVRLNDNVNTVIETDDGDAQLALYLNDEIVKGSIYGVGNAFSNEFITGVFTGALGPSGPTGPFDAQSQINGQVILQVRDYFSTLSLNNHCENDLIIDNHAGTDTETEDEDFWGNNVSASIVINRIEKNHHDD